MKTTTVSPTAYYAAKDPRANRYPNAARRTYFLERIMDGMLAAAITVAAVVILLFIFLAL